MPRMGCVCVCVCMCVSAFDGWVNTHTHTHTHIYTHTHRHTYTHTHSLQFHTLLKQAFIAHLVLCVNMIFGPITVRVPEKGERERIMGRQKKVSARERERGRDRVKCKRQSPFSMSGF